LNKEALAVIKSPAEEYEKRGRLYRSSEAFIQLD
jgi:hypothetical protein